MVVIKPFSTGCRAHDAIECDNFGPYCWWIEMVHFDNGIHQAVKIADGCVDVGDASHFAHVAQIGCLGCCSGSCFFDLLLLDYHESPFHSRRVFCGPGTCWGKVMECKMSFDCFRRQHRVLMCPCGASDRCCHWLVEEFRLQIAC